MKQLIVLAVAESMEQLQFISRCNAGIRNTGGRLFVISNSLRIHLSAVRTGMGSVIVRRRKHTERREADLTRSGEVINGVFSLDRSMEYYGAFYDTCADLIRQYEVSMVMIWGAGDTVACRAVLDATSSGTTRRLFLDYGNWPGLLFADPMGVNMRSFIANNIELLEQYPCSDDDIASAIQTLRNESPKGRFKEHRRSVIMKALDRVSSAIRRVPYRGNPLHASEKRRSVKHLKGSLSRFDRPLPKQYVLLPFSHSIELLKENGDLHIMREIIHNALSIGEHQQMPVVINCHPNEDSPDFFKLILEFVQHDRLIFSNERSRFLLRNANCVIGTNSSVAMHSIVMGIPLFFLQDSLYKGMNQNTVVRFINHYLLKIDPYAGEDLSTEQIHLLFDRANL